jgi:hypothetical protein
VLDSGRLRTLSVLSISTCKIYTVNGRPIGTVPERYPKIIAHHPAKQWTSIHTVSEA